ncbi:LOW QUALITY PROTEIN: hypothetical protein BC936DRAFT_138955 [Jimgerdemannia flammicorona]|uniref:Uncharacterized protein n=1 Tax=Jimgerdemannia flammicorona TaxID=994334 RepID=A0A433BCQ4_9FUNG|nr:LOW QUALITY PROTEIN: hypothetical protein BC936DRAFT_138955 [Jimgerdemannia flammicorona]
MDDERRKGDSEIFKRARHIGFSCLFLTNIGIFFDDLEQLTDLDLDDSPPYLEIITRTITIGKLGLEFVMIKLTAFTTWFRPALSLLSSTTPSQSCLARAKCSLRHSPDYLKLVVRKPHVNQNDVSWVG